MRGCRSVRHQNAFFVLFRIRPEGGSDMALLQRGLMLAVTAGTLAVPALVPKASVAPGPPTAISRDSAASSAAVPLAAPSHMAVYTADQKEFYLDAQAVAF